MSHTEWFFLLTGLLLVIVSFIHLIKYDAWWIRIWDFPHMQLALMSLLCLAGWLSVAQIDTLLDKSVTAGLLAALSYQLWLFLPYTRVYPSEMKHSRLKDESRTLSLMIANVLMDNRKYDRLLRLVDEHQPDILLVVETDEAWRRALKRLETSYPYRVLHPLPNTYGMMLYSRLRVKGPEVRFLIKDEIPSIRATIELPNGVPVCFYGVHPEPPSPTEHDRSTERDAELLLVGREARILKNPVIVAGDLNDVAWSHTTRLFQRISGLFDPRVGRGLFSTFHANYFFLRWPLDHIFASAHFKLRKICRMPHIGSDHFPIYVELSYEPDEEAFAETPRPEGDDQQEASEKIDKGIRENS